MPLSSLEHYLSYYLRVLLPHVLSTRSSHKVAYIFSLLSAVTAGFVSLISLYSYPWQKKLHYTSWEINTISSMVSLGAYLTPPILGIIADSHGPITLSCFSIIGFIPSYSYLAHVFANPELAENNSSFIGTVICFIIIGISTSALYFSALLTCTKLYPKVKLLSISIPTTCIGISSLIGSQILKIDWFWVVDPTTHEKYLNLTKVFKCLSWLYVVVGISAWIATGTVSLISCDEELENQKVTPTDNSQIETINDNEITSSSNDDLIESNPTERDHLLPRSRSSLSIGSAMITTEETQKQISNNTVRHLRTSVFMDPILYLLGFSMFLSLGPLEMFITDMSSLAKLLLRGEFGSTKNNDNIASSLISVFAFASTSARLITGAFTDYIINSKKSLKLILLPLLCLSLLVQLLVICYSKHILFTVNEGNLLVMSSLFGFIYGGLFTIYPTIVLFIWGQESFGSAYGTLMVAPAIGTAMSCLQYAHIYDSRCSREDSKGTCITPVYQVGFIQLILSLSITIFVLKYWKKRGHQI